MAKGWPKQRKVDPQYPSDDISPRCPKCKGMVYSDTRRISGIIVNDKKCVNCGLTSESTGWFDAARKVRVER